MSTDQASGPPEGASGTSTGEPTGPTPDHATGLVVPASHRRRRQISGRTVASSVLIALLIAAANWAFWSWLNRPPEVAAWAGPVSGFAFNGFRRDQSPEEGTFPTEQELDEDIEMLSHYSKRLRIYSARDTAAAEDTSVVPALARKYGMKITAGAWLSKDRTANDVEIKALIKLMRDNDNIDRVLVGNETLLRGDLTVKELIGYVDTIKRRARVPVSTAESWDMWLTGTTRAQEADARARAARRLHHGPPAALLGRRAALGCGRPRHPALPRDAARVSEQEDRHRRGRLAVRRQPRPDQESIDPNAPITYSTASVRDEAQFIREFLPRAKKEGINDYYLMEAIDQPWKRANEGRTGAYWGIFNADREPKFSLDGPVIVDPGWPRKATVASILALFPIIAFCIAFARFRLDGPPVLRRRDPGAR